MRLLMRGAEVRFERATSLTFAEINEEEILMPGSRLRSMVGFRLLGCALFLCGASTPVWADAAKEAQDIYKSRCATCHGESGKGDGAAAAALNPKPRNLDSDEWQGSVTDEHIEKIIVGGGPAVGMSPLMPPNPDLAAKAEVVQELRKIIRAFAAD